MDLPMEISGPLKLFHSLVARFLELLQELSRGSAVVCIGYVLGLGQFADGGKCARRQFVNRIQSLNQSLALFRRRIESLTSGMLSFVRARRIFGGLFSEGC